MGCLRSSVCCGVVLLLGFFASGSGVVACTLPSEVLGDWEVLDTTRTSVEHNITLSTTTLTGLTFWDKTLDYSCYIQQGDYYVFVSDTTDLFDMYNVKIFFCWYLLPYATDVYRLYELTDKVLYTVEERAKAYLNTTSPTVNDVCEIPFDNSLSYKQMQVLTTVPFGA